MKNNTLIVYIHGVYQTPKLWNGVISDLSNMRYNVEHMLITLPGYKNNYNTSFLLSTAKKINSNSYGKKLIIVGHSLGGALACQLLEYIESDKIVLCISSMPISMPNIYIKISLFFEKLLIDILNNIPFIDIPVCVRSKLITNYSDNNLLLSLVGENEYINFLSRNKSVIVNLGCGYMDFIAGGINKQKSLVYKLKENGIESRFFSFGFTGHHPLLLNRFKYVQWIIKAIKI